MSPPRPEGSDPDQTRTTPAPDPDQTRVGGWLFRHRTALPLPIAVAILAIPSGQTRAETATVLAGIALTVGGEAIRLWAVRHIGVISRTRSDRVGRLIDTGPFGLVRNPLYLGNIGIWVGFALIARLAWLAPIVLVLLAVEYHLIVRWEEGVLKARLGDPYRDYMQRVSRWIPGAASAVQPRHDLAYAESAVAVSWRDTFFSERGTLIAIAVGSLLLWSKARF